MGAWLIVSTLAGVAQVLGHIPLIIRTPGDSSPSIFEIGGIIAVAIAGIVVFAGIPGFLLIARAHALAHRVYQPSGGRSDISASALLAVGSILLGANLSVSGAAGIIGAGASTLMSFLLPVGIGRDVSLPTSVADLANSIVMLASGLALVFWGVHMAKRAG